MVLALASGFVFTYVVHICGSHTGAGWPGGPELWFCAGESGSEWAGPQQVLEHPFQLLGSLQSYCHAPPFSAAAEARPNPLSQAGLGLFSKPSLHGIGQSHVVMAFSPHLLLHDLEGVWGSFSLSLLRFWVPCQQVCAGTFWGTLSHAARRL